MGPCFGTDLVCQSTTASTNPTALWEGLNRATYVESYIPQAISNHATTLSKLSKSLSQLSLLLPSTKLTLILYPTPSLLSTVAKIYALIVRFLLESAKFYKASRLQHSFDSVFRPWKLRFQETYDDIAAQAAQLRQLSNLAAKAELRDIHLELIEYRRVCENMSSQITGMNSAQVSLEALVERKVSEQMALLSSKNNLPSFTLSFPVVFSIEIRNEADSVVTSFVALSTEIRLDLSQQAQTINQIHVNQLLSMPFWQHLPSSGESLEYCESLRRRRSHLSSVVLPQEAELQTWAQQPSSSLLALTGQSQVYQKDFMTGMARIICEQNLPVIWALRFANHWDLDLTPFDILRMLVIQALQLKSSSETCLEGSGRANLNPITLSHLREAASLDDWLKILEQALKNIPRIFILLDGDILSQAASNDRHEATILAELLRTKMATAVKVIVPASNLDTDFVDTLRLQGDCVSIATDVHINRGRHTERSYQARRRVQRVKRRPMSNWMTGYLSKRRRV